MKKSRRSFFVTVVSFAIAAMVTTAQPDYSDWSAPVNLGPVVNSAFLDSGPALSKNGLSLYFYSQRTGGLGQGDIWVSQRTKEEEPWGPPANLGPVVNSIFGDILPNQSRDGHWLFFTSDRPGGSGGPDIWVSYREHIHDDLGWQPPVNAGPGVNSPGVEQDSSFFANDDAGVAQLFFVRDADIYVSNLLEGGTFGPAIPVSELNSAANERGISVNADGLEAFFLSTRSGQADLWTSTRSTVLDAWSVPTNLGPLVNSVAVDQTPDIASDRKTLYFGSDRVGGFGAIDLYVISRSKKKP